MAIGASDETIAEALGRSALEFDELQVDMIRVDDEEQIEVTFLHKGRAMFFILQPKPGKGEVIRVTGIKGSV